MKFSTAFLFFSWLGFTVSFPAVAAPSTNASIVIEGTVRDGKGQPVTKCDVFFNKEKWITDDSVHVTCNEKGQYRAEIAPGHYNSLYICDEDKYARTALEFWGWNLTLTESQVIDAAFDTIEVYSLSTWVSNGGSNSLFASFRPMLLQNASMEQKMQLTPANWTRKTVNGKALQVLDVSPELTHGTIAGFIDGSPITLVDFFWSYEKFDQCGGLPDGFDPDAGCYMPMVIAQFAKPKLSPGQHTLKVRLTDQPSGQMGEGITHFFANQAGYGF